MFDIESIKELAKTIGRPVIQCIALAYKNDPFYIAPARYKAAEWFADLWQKHGTIGSHIRRIHYRLVSPPEGVVFLKPDGEKYQNTVNDWSLLCEASRDARYLDLIPFDALIDRKNDEPMMFAVDTDDPDEPDEVSAEAKRA
jgi:hypothetical protein